MRENTDKLISDLIELQETCIRKAITISNAQLDNEVTLGSRELPIRNILYMLVAHPREHSIHISKILQATNAPTSMPTEAQMILAKAKESMGELLGTFARLEDSDLEREFDGHTLQGILEHLKHAHENYLSAIEGTH